MSAYTREKWNQLIRDINTVITNPPPGCTALAPLKEVGTSHKWSKKADIQAAQDALKAICGDIAFTATPLTWKQPILDEITTALKTGWCGCKENHCAECSNPGDCYVWEKSTDGGSTWEYGGVGTFAECRNSALEWVAGRPAAEAQAVIVTCF